MKTDMISVRWARHRDAEALTTIYEESWRGAYQGIIPHVSLMRILALRGAASWRQRIRRDARNILVLEFDGEVVGYANIGANRSKHFALQGEIFELYVLPLYQGLGLGGRLFDEAWHVLEGRGFKGLVVWALTDNSLAEVFYRRKGGQPGLENVEHFSGHKLRKCAYLWPER